MIFLIILIVVLTVGLIGVGLLLIKEQLASPQSVSLPSGLVPELLWKRPVWVPWPLATWKVILFVLIGLFGLWDLIDSLNFYSRFGIAPGPCSFLLPVGGAVLVFLGVRDWLRLQALKTRGQLAQGVIFDRWTIQGKGKTYCVAYYFELPWGSLDGSRVIRAEVNKRVYHAFQIGDAIPIRYLPDKPKVCRVES
jgi:hypothetical protein